MAGLNKVILMGNLVADPEYKTTPSGVGVTTFRIAVGRRFAKQGDEVTADFFSIVAWRNTAEFVSKYFTKGRMAVVDGRLETRNWTDKEGNKRKAVEVVAESVYFGDSKKESSGGASYGGYEMPAAGGFSEINEEDGDLPF